MGDRFTDSNMNSMIASRMGWNMDDPKCPLRRYFAFTCKGKEKIGVFVLMGDRHTTIEDDAALFPSDQFVTQLRMFIGTDADVVG